MTNFKCGMNVLMLLFPWTKCIMSVSESIFNSSKKVPSASYLIYIITKAESQLTEATWFKIRKQLRILKHITEANVLSVSEFKLTYAWVIIASELWMHLLIIPITSSSVSQFQNSNHGARFDLIHTNSYRYVNEL